MLNKITLPITLTLNVPGLIGNMCEWLPDIDYKDRIADWLKDWGPKGDVSLCFKEDECKNLSDTDIFEELTPLLDMLRLTLNTVTYNLLYSISTTKYLQLWEKCSSLNCSGVKVKSSEKYLKFQKYS